MKKVDPNTSGGRLRAARMAAGRSMDDLAAHAGFSRTHINKMELNTYTGGREAWAAVGGALGLSLDYLLFGSGPSLKGGDKTLQALEAELALVRRAWALLRTEERDGLIVVIESMTAQRIQSA